MRVRNHGKYTHMRRNSPRGIGTCDASGLVVQHALMVEQKAYRGRGLVGTGLRVNPKFYDKPNAQDLTPLIRIDPRPLLNARPDSQIGVTPDTTLILNIIDNTVISNKQFKENTNFIINGALDENTILFVPAVFNDFYLYNQTTGGFQLSMQIIGSYQTSIDLPIGKSLICNDSMTLTIIHPN